MKKEDQAWESVFAYKRRWQIELSFRYGKCELAMESPRLWSFENRLKLLGIVTLVYAFLWHLKDARKVLRKFGMTHKYDFIHEQTNPRSVGADVSRTPPMYRP